MCDYDYTDTLKTARGFIYFINKKKLCIPSQIAYDIIIFGEQVFKRQLNIGYMGSINFKDRLMALTMQHFLPKVYIICSVTYSSWY